MNEAACMVSIDALQPHSIPTSKNHVEKKLCTNVLSPRFEMKSKRPNETRSDNVKINSSCGFCGKVAVVD